MTRRSTPQHKTDDAAFPVRMRIHVPSGGFGRRMDDLRSWLERELGRTEFAWHAGGRMAGPSDLSDCCALYFRAPADAARCREAFPWLELADGTALSTYASPNLPFGRQEEPDDPVCNLYNQTTTQEAMRRLFAKQVFAGIEIRGWSSVRKVKDGETTDDLFGFLTCAPNAAV